MSRISVRTRLALWFGGGLVAISLSLAGASALLLLRGMRSELDADLRRDHARVVEHIETRPGGKIRLRGSYRYDGHGNDGTQRFLDIVGPHRQPIFRSKRPAKRHAHLPQLRSRETSRLRSTRLPDGLRVRRLSQVVERGGKRYTVHLAHSEKRVWSTVNNLLLIVSILLPLTFLAAGLGGWALARKALQPIRNMTDLTRKIRASNLAAVRIPLDNPTDELGQLAAVLNEMLARIDAAFENLKRFTSDASHELRTPLATLKTLGEVSLQGSESAEDLRETVVSMLKETNRMAELVETLLLLSRADAGRIELEKKDVDPAKLVADTIEIINVLADDKGLTLHVALDRVPSIHADARLLRQAVINLLHNAIKYTPAPGEISVTVREASGTQIIVEVTDTGIGMDLAKHPDIFERFYRINDDRSRDSGGSGLGLAITRWVARAHSGDITAESTPDQGSSFTLSLPLPNPTK